MDEVKAANGEDVGGEHAGASGHAAKKRKRQKALAAVAANGHVSKVALRKPAGSNGAVVVEDPPALGEPEDAATVEELDDAGRDGATVEAPAVDELGEAERNGATVEAQAVDELGEAEGNGATVEAPAVDELDEAQLNGATVEAPADDELAEVETFEDDLPPADGARRTRERVAKRATTDANETARRGRAAKRAASEETAPRGRAARRAAREGRSPRERAAQRAAREERAPRRRAARRARAARPATPAARRAELVATAAEIAAAAAAAEAQPASAGRKRTAKIARRMFALIAIAMVPASAYALVVTDGPSPSLTSVDASFMSAQLMTADQRVRRELVRLRPRQTSAALARTRDATLTARSLALELARIGGKDAGILRRALTLQSAWLDAVGSVLMNPRSPLRDELVARDALLRPALDALPVPSGRRKGGAERLVRYANARISAARGR